MGEYGPILSAQKIIIMKEALIELYQRDLQKLKKEILLYQDESNMWIVEGSITNSAGNLCLHLIGNLKAFIGATLAQSGYIRQREREFSDKNVSRADMLVAIDETIEVVTEGLSQLSTAQMLQLSFPIKIWKKETSMSYTLIHLHSHLNYHLGQINYHRRLLDTQHL